MPVESPSLKELFLAALAVAAPERAAWLERECGQEAERRQLELMLAAHDMPQSLLDRWSVLGFIYGTKSLTRSGKYPRTNHMD